MNATSIAQPLELASTPIGVEVLRGLTGRSKTLSPWLFYDQQGSRLFEAITELPEYYLTRTERNILAGHAAEIIAEAADGRKLTVFELGAGTATKTGLLLKAAIRHQARVTYHALDVSRTALAEAKTRLEMELPGVTVRPQVVDYTAELAGIASKPRLGIASGLENRSLVLYIGSSIGNFDPEDALALLRRVRAQLEPGDGLLLGVDMVKDERLLLAAYDDAAGVTAKFNKNILARINRELDADFNLEHFRHRALWNERQSRVEMHLESTAAQQVSIASLELKLSFARGETIHTENSYKFTPERVSEFLGKAGFTLRRRWSDAGEWFGVYLAGAC